MKKIKLGNWTFFLLTALYMIISGWLFLLTSGGWSEFGVFLYTWLPFAILSLVMFIVTVLRAVKHIKYISYNLLGLVPVVLLQIFGLLLNRKDCGDASGSFSFLSYLSNGFNSLGMCGNDNRYAEYNINLWILIIAIYIISIVISFFFMTKSIGVDGHIVK